ncbi:MAG TPA: NlpC/P60 family protein [Lacibacter sp.]|nr:NlpC/P60 family protein [Lacibacter sp.]
MIRHLITYLSAILLLTSCSAVKNAFQPKPSTTASASADEKNEVRPEYKRVRTGSSTSTQPSSIFQTKDVANYSSSLELFSLSQFKYAIRLDVPVEIIQNKPLYELIDNWWGTPYRLGGTTQKGIDCSAFVQTLMVGVFAMQLPRTAREQKEASSPIPMDDLKEGDLIFFNTRGGVSHVGVYLHNNKFVHASTSGGVMISDLNETYWSRRLLGAGRVLQNSSPKP